MAAGDASLFDKWLLTELVKFNKDVDLEIFESYIKGILETESGDELQESLFEIISQLKPEEDDLSKNFCERIISKWTEEITKSSSQQHDPGDIGVNMHDLISLNLRDSILHHAHASTDNKEVILKNYSQVSSGDESGTEEVEVPAKGGHKHTSDEKTLVRNTNASEVKKREKEMREKSRKDTEAKKNKDKEDREKQKHKEKERKEGEKKRTQKGEKRRG